MRHESRGLRTSNVCFFPPNRELVLSPLKPLKPCAVAAVSDQDEKVPPVFVLGPDPRGRGGPSLGLQSQMKMLVPVLLSALMIELDLDSGAAAGPPRLQGSISEMRKPPAEGGRQIPQGPPGEAPRPGISV